MPFQPGLQPNGCYTVRHLHTFLYVLNIYIINYIIDYVYIYNIRRHAVQNVPAPESAVPRCLLKLSPDLVIPPCLTFVCQGPLLDILCGRGGSVLFLGLRL